MFSVDCSHCGRCEYLAKTLASGWLHLEHAVDPPTVLVSASLLLTTVAWHVDNDVAHHVKLLVPRVLR